MTGPRRARGGNVVLVLTPPIDPAAAVAQCERACAGDGSAAVGGGDRVLIDVGGLSGADLGTVDLLARLAIEARRAGRRLELRDAPADLRQLVALIGLARILPSESAVSRRGAAADRRAGRVAPCRGRT